MKYFIIIMGILFGIISVGCILTLAMWGIGNGIIYVFGLKAKWTLFKSFILTLVYFLISLFVGKVKITWNND